MFAPRGERGALNLNPDYFLQLQRHPFCQYQKDRVSVWLEQFIQYCIDIAIEVTKV